MAHKRARVPKNSHHSSLPSLVRADRFSPALGLIKKRERGRILGVG
jgi:hypothetical protein